MLDAGSDGCSRSLVPSVGGLLTDLSAAGAVIPTAVTVPRFFFFFTLVVWFPTTIPIEKYYPTFHRGLTVSAWASCRDWVAYSNFRCWLHVMKCEFNVIIFHSWMASLALYQRLTAPASLNQVTCKYWPSLEMKVLILHHMLSVIQVLSLNASSLSGYNKQNPDKPLHTVHRYTTRWLGENCSISEYDFPIDYTPSCCLHVFELSLSRHLPRHYTEMNCVEMKTLKLPWHNLEKATYGIHSY